MATACFWGLPSLISVLMFLLIEPWLYPLINGIPNLLWLSATLVAPQGRPKYQHRTALGLVVTALEMIATSFHLNSGQPPSISRS